VIVVDSSALVAVVLGELEAERLLDVMVSQPCAVSAATLTEAAIVVEARQGPDAARDLDLLVDGAIDQVVAVDLDHHRAALAAWRRFGKGRHPAGLNFGDCLAYAAAALMAAPLLFKGEDFDQTDVAIAPF
jgi:ribonuclease VapC